MKYEAVIFDLFGTLINKFSLQESLDVLRQMASTLSAPPDDFMQIWFDTFNMRDVGAFQSLEANIEYICNKLNLHPADTHITLAAQIDREYIAHSIKPRPHATELLSYLKSLGCKTGLITNCTSEVAIVWKDMPFAPSIDVAVFSCLEGLRKPDPRIYNLAIEKLAVEPENCLYIGDGDSKELTGASQVGMHPVLIRDPDENSAEVHRVNFEGKEWEGPVISSLKDVLTLVE